MAHSKLGSSHGTEMGGLEPQDARAARPRGCGSMWARPLQRATARGSGTHMQARVQWRAQAVRRNIAEPSSRPTERSQRDTVR